jgi:hypothetical protein
MEQFAIQYDYRKDGGPMLVGPFPSRPIAETYAESLSGMGWEASYTIGPIATP